jgi:DNA repair exonuclease SbcCD nuclease subunit
MPPLRIVHTADFHLGASLREISDPALEMEREKDYLKRLKRA